MSKIIQAINSMIANKHLIGDVITTDGELLYFSFMKKYKWSISKNSLRKPNLTYTLLFYPGKQTLSDLAAMDDYRDFNEYVRYSTDEFNSMEATNSFAELYTVLKEKIFDVDKVLDEIILSDA